MKDISEIDVGSGFGAFDRTQTGVVDRITIERAIDALAPGYRRFFLLHDVHGLGHPDVASMKGCSQGTSKSQVHKARRA
jgi:RNA polymerase sigma-70 factor (ECF subfamily)